MTPKLGLVLTLAIIAGVRGWCTTHRRRRSFYDTKPPGLTDTEYEQRQHRRHNLRRLGVTALYAVGGAVVGWTIGLMPMFR